MTPASSSSSDPDEYWGVRRIARRMHWSVDTLMRMHRDEAFLMVRMPLKGCPRHHSRWAWMTSEALITRWLVAKAITDRQQQGKRRRTNEGR